MGDDFRSKFYGTNERKRTNVLRLELIDDDDVVEMGRDARDYGGGCRAERVVLGIEKIISA